MNYNPIKLQNDLRLIPTATLIQYVQGMNPEVPSYMALGVLKERKEMEAKYEAENQKTPESSVAEDLTQAPQGGLQMLAGNPMGGQAQPNQAPQGAPTMPADQGLASLDTGDMYQEDSFAGGGIVAFADGGLTDRTFASDFGVIQKYLTSLPQHLIKPFIELASKTSAEKAYQTVAKNYPSMPQTLLDESPVPKKTKLAEPGLASLNTGLTNKFTSEDISTMEPYRKAAMPRVETPPTTQAVTPPVDVTTPMQGPAPTSQQAGIEGLLEDTDGLAEKRMTRYKQMVGEDPERGRLEELARKYETGAAEQERMAPWMALAKAGFSMAGGKSPFAVQNLAEGAQAGLADYVQARDRLDKLTEKQIDIRTKMQQARRAEDIAATTYGLNSEAAIEARNAQVKLKDLEEKNAFNRTKYAADVSTKNAMIAAARKSDYETFIAEAKKDRDNYKQIKDKDGNIKEEFDINKVTQFYKSFGGSSGLDDDKLFAEYQLEKRLDKNFKKSFQEYKSEIRGTSGGAAPTANRPPLGNIFNTK
jgi:hypothetical protein